MVGEFERFNQAVAQEEQLKLQEKQTKDLISTERQKTQQQKQLLQKQARQQVLAKGTVDPFAVRAVRQQIARREIQISEAEQLMQEQKKTISQEKSQIKTKEQLEKQGFMKRVSGNQTIYFKEDDYRPKKSSKNRKIFIREEYTFVNGTPTKIVKRDDFSIGDRRRVDDELIIKLKDGKVTDFDKFKKGERRESEDYDSQGRLIQLTKYTKQGRRKSKESFKYDVEAGTVQIETKKFGDKPITSTKRQRIDITAELSGVGTSQETLIEKRTVGGVTETTTIKRDITRPTRTRTKRETKVIVTPTLQTQLSQDLLAGFEQPEQFRLAQTQTSTPEQIKAFQQQKTFDVGSGAFGKEFVIGGPLGSDLGTININPGRIVTAPLIFGAETVATRGGNILEGILGFTTSVQQVGVVETGAQIAKGTVQSIATDPFGFVGEAAVGGVFVKPFTRLFKPKTTIERIDLETTTKTLETSPQAQGFGIQQVEIKGTVDISQPKGFKDFFKGESTGPSTTPRINIQRVDIEATGLIEKQTKVFGKPDPKIEIDIVKANQISTEFGPTDFLEGQLDFKIGSKVKTVPIEAIRQGDLQITTIGGKTALSRTEPTIKLDDVQLFRTRTLDPVSRDLTVSLSQGIDPRKTTLPTQDLFASASRSQTDIFIKVNEFKPIPEQIIDVKSVDTPKPQIISTTPFGVGDSPIFIVDTPKFSQIGSTVGVSQRIDDIFAIKTKPTPKETPKAKGQEQIFEEVQFTEQIQSPIAKLDSKSLFESKTDIKTTQTPFDIQIPTSFIKSVVTEQKGLSFAPILSFQQQPQVFTQQQPQVFEKGVIQRKQPVTEQGFELGIVQTADTKFSFDFGTIFDTKVKQDQKQIQEQVSISPTQPPTSPITVPVFPTTPPKFKLDIASFGTATSSKKKKDKSSIGEGIFISSLGGLLTGLTTKEPPKTLTGLEIRGFIIQK